MFRIIETKGRFVYLQASSKLSKHDYERLVPQLERVIDNEGRLRVLIELDHFDGWSAGGFWQDLRFDWAHRRDFERVAVVGDRRWQQWVLRVAKPFFSGEFKFFEQGQEDQARAWVLQETQERAGDAAAAGPPRQQP